MLWSFDAAGLNPQTFGVFPSPEDRSAQQSSTSSLPPERIETDEQNQPLEKVFSLRRSSRITAAPPETDSDGDSDEEHMQRLLLEGISDENKFQIDEGADSLRSVERKCPYCADRFHNGIGLANHVRGHLNRVGVSYNVRHFISPEEVNAIEKKFSYQKKKKKGQRPVLCIHVVF